MSGAGQAPGNCAGKAPRNRAAQKAREKRAQFLARHNKIPAPGMEDADSDDSEGYRLKYPDRCEEFVHRSKAHGTRSPHVAPPSAGTLSSMKKAVSSNNVGGKTPVENLCPVPCAKCADLKPLLELTCANCAVLKNQLKAARTNCEGLTQQLDALRKKWSDATAQRTAHMKRTVGQWGQ